MKWKIRGKWMAFCDWLKWLGRKESDVEAKARKELELAGYFDEDGMYGDMLGVAVMELLRVFADQGHSGMSASITAAVFNALAKHEPLSPLTGEDDEWKPCGKNRWQNTRCFSVFKEIRDGQVVAYDSDGRIFREPDGSCYTSADSFVDVTFPYTPEKEYVDVTWR